MTNSVAGHYYDELVNWDNTLDLYAKKMLELENKLTAIIQQNTIPNLAFNAQQYLNQFLMLQPEIDTLDKDMYQQELNLKKNDGPIWY